MVVETEASITSTTLTLTPGTSAYTLNAAIIRIKEMFVTYGGAQYAPVRQTNLDEILRRRVAGAAPTSGSITHYALLGLSDLEVYPTPASADVVTIYYVALPTALSANGDIPILQEPWNSSLLADGASAKAADFKSDPQEQSYRQLFEVGKSKFRAHLARRQGSQVQQLAVGNGYSWPPHDPSLDVRGW